MPTRIAGLSLKHPYALYNRSNRPAKKNFPNFTGKHKWQSVFTVHSQAQLAVLLKELYHWCFPGDFRKFFQKIYLLSQYEQLQSTRLVLLLSNIFLSSTLFLLYHLHIHNTPLIKNMTKKNGQQNGLWSSPFSLELHTSN